MKFVDKLYSLVCAAALFLVLVSCSDVTEISEKKSSGELVNVTIRFDGSSARVIKAADISFTEIEIEKILLKSKDKESEFFTESFAVFPGTYDIEVYCTAIDSRNDAKVKVYGKVLNLDIFKAVQIPVYLNVITNGEESGALTVAIKCNIPAENKYRLSLTDYNTEQILEVNFTENGLWESFSDEEEPVETGYEFYAVNIPSGYYRLSVERCYVEEGIAGNYTQLKLNDNIVEIAEGCTTECSIDDYSNYDRGENSIPAVIYATAQDNGKGYNGSFKDYPAFFKTVMERLEESDSWKSVNIICDEKPEYDMDTFYKDSIYGTSRSLAIKYIKEDGNEETYFDCSGNYVNSFEGNIFSPLFDSNYNKIVDGYKVVTPDSLNLRVENVASSDTEMNVYIVELSEGSQLIDESVITSQVTEHLEKNPYSDPDGKYVIYKAEKPADEWWNSYYQVEIDVFDMESGSQKYYYLIQVDGEWYSSKPVSVEIVNLKNSLNFVYVSSAGKVSNSGEDKEHPVDTIEQALFFAKDGAVINVLDDMDYDNENQISVEKSCTIRGNTKDTVLRNFSFSIEKPVDFTLENITFEGGADDGMMVSNEFIHFDPYFESDATEKPLRDSEGNVVEDDWDKICLLLLDGVNINNYNLSKYDDISKRIIYAGEFVDASFKDVKFDNCNIDSSSGDIINLSCENCSIDGMTFKNTETNANNIYLASGALTLDGNIEISSLNIETTFNPKLNLGSKFISEKIFLSYSDISEMEGKKVCSTNSSAYTDLTDVFVIEDYNYSLSSDGTITKRD